MKVILPIFCILLLNNNALGQEKQTDNKLCLKIAPLAIFDIYSGMSPRIGFEYKLKTNLAIYHEFGTYIPNANGMHQNKGFLTKAELKKYLNSNNLTTGNYLSAELFYKHQNYSTNDTISGLYKNYHVQKDVGCFTIKYGMLNIIKYNIVIDSFFGFGIRYKITSSTLSTEENRTIIPNGDYHINVLLNKAGTFVLPNFDAGIKVGYRLK